MKYKSLSLLLVCTVLCNCIFAQNTSDRLPYVLFNDFETGELFGWETYPYAQDIGFDALFSTSKTPTYKDSKYAIARPFKAHDTNELYQGFTKRLNLYTNSDTRVKAAIYFQSDRNPESLELSLGTFDGRRYMHKIDRPLANKWLELDIPISLFKQQGQSLKADEHIQVITIKGSYPAVNYLFTYTILMDDFQINGERDRRFTASLPTSTSFDMFDVSILNKHFFYGDNINLKAAAEGDGLLKQVKGTLVDSKGKVVKDNIAFSRSADCDCWENQTIYKLTEKDARGQWNIRLKGLNEQGAEVNQTFRFLVPGNKIEGHPRLLFSAEEIKTRLANEKSPIAKKILDNALEDKSFMEVNVDSVKEGIDRTAENLVGGPYAKNTLGFAAFAEWNVPNRTLGEVIEAGSFYYSFTGDKAAAEQAKKALLKLCSFSKWNNNWMLERKFWMYFYEGFAIRPVSLGYDMLYHLMTEQERAFVREALMEKGIKPFYRDMVEMNRMPSNQTNHIALMVGSLGLAATTMYGDDPNNPNLEPYLSSILTKAKTFIDNTYYEDGSYAEPYGYMDGATMHIVEVLAAFERNFGVDYSTTTNIKNFYKYPILATDSNQLIHSYGDAARTYNGFNMDHTLWLAHRTKDPYLYKYAKKQWDAGKGGYLGYLWYRDDITAKSREDDLPLSKVFSAQGMVMRSGWDDASTIITTRVGPNGNHYHYDQGSFQIMKNGEELLTDPGYGGPNYYENLEFLSYDVQAIAHNVLLIDHDPESQTPAHYDNGIKALRDWPRMTHTFTGKIADAVESDLSSVYKDKLKKYSRTLLYTKSGPIFLFDQVKSKTGGHVYNWLFHASQNEDHSRALDYKDNRMTIDRPKARLTMDVISFEAAGLPLQGLSKNGMLLDNSSASIRDRYNKKFSESFLTLVSKPDLEETNFFAVLMPEAKPKVGNFGDRPVTSRMDLPGWLGAKIDSEAGSDIGFFRIGAEPSASAGGFTTDAKRFTASFDKGKKLKKAYFEGTNFSGHGISLTIADSATVAIALNGGGTDLELQSEKATTISVFFPKKPLTVSLNEQLVNAWTYDTNKKTIAIQLPSGRVDLKIK